MDFEKLNPEARKAAFAHMDAKRLGKGARHKKLSAKKKAAVEHQGRGKVSGKLGSGSVKGQLSAADRDKGSLGGKLPVAKARPSAPQQAAPSQPDTPEARAEKLITGVVDKLTESRGGRGEWAGLVDLRKELDASGMSRAEQDAHLKRMSKEGKASIVPEDNRKALRPEDHEAAIRIGGDDNHLVSLTAKPAATPPQPKPLPSTDPKKLAASRTPEDHADLAQKFLQMHGDAGVEHRISMLEKRTRLGPGERAQLAALKALKRK